MIQPKLGGWRPESTRVRSNVASEQFDILTFDRVSNRFLASASPTSLRKFSPKYRHNQVQTSTCTAQASIRALEIKRIQRFYKQFITQGLSEEEALLAAHSKHVALSTLAPYYLGRERMVPAETDLDRGCYLSLIAEVVRTFGVCPEEDWFFGEFDGSEINPMREDSKIYKSPTWASMRRAYTHKITNWYNINSTSGDRLADVIKAVSDCPVVYGTMVGDNWTNYQAGQILGKPNKILGGHATTLLADVPELGALLGENSWGDTWGDSGFYLVSYDVIADDELSNDFVVYQAGWEDWAAAA